MNKLFASGLVVTSLWAGVFGSSAVRADVELLNVSYDPTRELYADLNEKFAEDWKSQTGETVSIQQSHGGSGKQAERSGAQEQCEFHDEFPPLGVLAAAERTAV